MYDEKARQIFNIMIDRGVLPETGEFEITDNLLKISYEIGNEIFSRKSKSRRPSDIRFHKKLAGINLLHLLNERSKHVEVASYKRNKSIQSAGILYIIENKAFPEFLKIGITKDLNARISSYQTYDPYRSYKVKKYIFIQNVRNIEIFLLKTFGVSDTYTGEWISIDNLSILENYMNSL